MILNLMPAVEKFILKSKDQLEKSKFFAWFQDTFPLKALQTSSIEWYCLAVNFYQNCCSASKQNSIPNGLFKIVKELRLRLDKNHPNITEEMIDQFAIKNEVVKLPLLLLKLDRKLGNFLDISKVPFKNWIVHKWING